LYKELNEDEKVGDLYVILNDKVKANKYFEKVIENYKTNFQYVKASLVYKNKIGDCSQAQDLLMEGWRANKDAGKCLNNYFANTN
jgi:Tfp pilus assembly protein PilF